MRKIIYFLLLALMVNFCYSVTSFADTENSTDHERVIVTFESQIDKELLTDLDVEIHHSYELFPTVAISASQNQIERLKANDNVVSIKEDTTVKVVEQKIDYGIGLTNTKNAWKADLTGEGVKVAVIDTGVSITHPDLNIAGGKSFVESDSTYNDIDGHGTHVAGIIAAQNNNIGSVGVAPSVSLYALRAMVGDVGDASSISAAVEWAILNNMDIINLSITGNSEEPNPLLAKMINIAYNKGILIVAAAGNYSGTVRYPAKLNSVIGVGAVNSNEDRAGFSPTGPNLEMVAPGFEIYSSFTTNGIDTYTKLSGTSMATPYVVGVLALYKEALPQVSNKDLRKILHLKAIDLGMEGKDYSFGFGLVHAPDSVFWDISSTYQFTAYINYLETKDIVGGFKDGTFKAKTDVKRSEAIVMVGRLLDLNGTKRDNRFTDVESSNFASGYIQSAFENDIIKGYNDGTFRPNENVTRAEMAILVAKAFKLANIEPIKYTDVSKSIASYRSIQKIQAAGIGEGYGDKTFRPYNLITRGQFSAFIARGDNTEFRLN